MVQQVKHPDEAEADLGKPGELLSLDVASYAAGLASDSENGESSERRISDTSWDESRPPTVAELPPIETLREIEAWFVAQDARTRTNNRVLAELQAARADAEARAPIVWRLSSRSPQRALPCPTPRAARSPPPPPPPLPRPPVGALPAQHRRVRRGPRRGACRVACRTNRSGGDTAHSADKCFGRCGAPGATRGARD